jgi:hypothetical protein
LVVAWLLLRPLPWMGHVLPKSRLTFNRLHCVIFQKIELFITTAVSTSNPTYVTSLRKHNAQGNIFAYEGWSKWEKPDIAIVKLSVPITQHCYWTQELVYVI